MFRTFYTNKACRCYYLQYLLLDLLVSITAGLADFSVILSRCSNCQKDKARSCTGFQLGLSCSQVPLVVPSLFEWCWYQIRIITIALSFLCISHCHTKKQNSVDFLAWCTNWLYHGQNMKEKKKIRQKQSKWKLCFKCSYVFKHIALFAFRIYPWWWESWKTNYVEKSAIH